MKVIIAVKKQEVMERYMEYKNEKTEINIVDRKDLFDLHISYPVDIICVDAGLFTDVYPWVWMDQIKSSNAEASVYIALDTVTYDTAMLSIIEKLAIDYGFTLIPAQISDEKTAFEFAKQIFGLERSATPQVYGGGKFITVLPAASADGASTVALNTALAIASKTTLRVGLIDGNLKNPSLRSHLNISDRIKSNFQIRAKMQTGSLDSVSLESAFVVHKKFSNLYVLPGSPRRETASDVTPEMIFHLMNVARQTFHITIMDVSSFADNAATVCGVRYADERWLVSQALYSSYRISWKEWYECYWRLCGLSPSDFKLVVNRYQETDNIPDILDFLGMDLAGKIPNVGGGLGIKSVHDGIPLYLQTSNQIDAFVEATNHLASSIYGQESDKFVASAAEPKSEGFFRRLLLKSKGG